ncbi:hypothetical protein [Dickeya chrysanthemi]|uniref:hypothetical protein n=1 Tax=Dickeya chrysanthemi TaxID=556 RepID=UPI003016C36B
MSLFDNIFFVCFIASQAGKTMASVAEKPGAIIAITPGDSVIYAQSELSACLQSALSR